MRPRVTFRTEGRWHARARWLVEYARAEDAELPDELAQLLQQARWHYDSAAWPPARQDLRATLQALLAAPESDLQGALQLVDPWTEAQLATAALKLARLAHPVPAELPAQVFDKRTWSADQVREFAQLALEGLPRPLGGRRSARWADAWLMRALLRLWRRGRGRKLSARDQALLPVIEQHRSLATFARAMFARVDRLPSESTLRSLRAAALRRAG